MATTPEGRIKNLVKKMLASFGEEVYSHWPVQNGMGSPTLDCIGSAWGFYFGIETKAPGKKPTPRQELTMAQIKAAGGVVFVIASEDEVERCRYSLEMLKHVASYRVEQTQTGGGTAL